MLNQNPTEVFNWNDFNTEADRPAPSAEYEKAITEALEVANGPKAPELTAHKIDADTVQLSIVKA